MAAEQDLKLLTFTVQGTASSFEGGNRCVYLHSLKLEKELLANCQHVARKNMVEIFVMLRS